MKRRIAWGLIPMTVLAIASFGVRDLAAQPKERHEERKERREDRKEDRKEHRDELKDEWKKKRADWSEHREERRKDRREAIRAKWGVLVDRPLVREELRIHARRMARLQRVVFLADATGKPELKTKADKLIADEDIRFNARMDALKVEAK
jgi:hypothetical protein